MKIFRGQFRKKMKKFAGQFILLLTAMSKRMGPIETSLLFRSSWRRLNEIVWPEIWIIQACRCRNIGSLWVLVGATLKFHVPW